MVGSMGCVASFALGLSLALPEKRIVVLDGDGAALMRMGNFATVGAYAGSNFLHVLLDNAVHESTGGQSTVSSAISFAAVAAACGYADAREEISRDKLENFLLEAQGPGLMQLHIRTGVPEDLPRPSMRPLEVRKRLMQHLGVSAPWAAAQGNSRQL
jgi:phosphonopyruvate decarboxylase